MGFPQLLGRAGRWLWGSDQPTDDERPLIIQRDLIAEYKLLSRVSELLISEMDEKLGIEHPHDWAKFAESYGAYGWLYACVSTIAQSIAGVPLRVYQRRGGEVRVAPPENALSIVLDQVNPQADWPRYCHMMVVDLELCGDHFLYKALAASKKPHLMQLWRLRPEWVRVLPDKNAPESIGGYKYMVNSKEITFDTDEIVHILYPNPNNDWYGLGALPPAKDAADVDSYAIESNRALLKRGANPRGYLKFDSEGITEEQARQAAEDFDKRYAGSKAHRTVGLRGASFEPIQWNPRDLEYNNLRKMNRQEIAAVFKVPLALLGVEEHSKYTLHEYRKIFWEDCLVPKMRLIEGALNEFLAPDFGRQFFVKFDLSQVPALQRNIQDEARLWLDMVKGRVALPNEMRAALPELFDEPLPAGIGNVFWGNFNEIPLVSGPRPEPEKALMPQMVSASQKALPSADEDKKKPEPLVKVFTEPTETLIWKAFMDRVEGLMPRMQAAAAVIMRDETDGVLERLQKRGAKSLQTKGLNGWLDAILFNYGAEGKRFVHDLQPYQLNALETAGTEAVAEVGVDITFNLVDPAVIQFIKDREIGLKTVAKTNWTALRGSLADGYKQGETIRQLSERVGEFRDTVDWRAERIARTETIGCANRGGYEGYKQAGMPGKKWIHTRGTENPREAHEALAGQGPIPIGQDFVSALGGSGPCPGSLGPQDDISCSCTLVATDLPK